MKQNLAGIATQIRIARPTNQLEKVRQFYVEGLGLSVIGSFSGHASYNGVMIGLPNSSYHLEFTEHTGGHALPIPTKENLLVFYFDTPSQYKAANEQLQRLGYAPVLPQNPYWKGKSKTYEDPDKWRIVLFDGAYKLNQDKHSIDTEQ